MKSALRVLALCLAAGTAAADSFVQLDRRVSDEAFHRAVACAAEPEGPCREPMAAWPVPQRRALTVSLRAQGGEGANPRRAQVGQALDAAIGEINRAGADLHLVRLTDDTSALITLWDSNLREGEPILLPEEGLDGEALMEGARVEIWWDDRFRITRAVIVVAGDLASSDLRSVVLEELVQSLGLLTDLTGDAYADSSIFSESTNAVTRLHGQDAAAVRLHYPRE